MKAFDQLTDPEAQEFDFFDWETLVWVGVAWLVCVALVAMMCLVDRMTQDVLDAISPRDKPKPE